MANFNASRQQTPTQALTTNAASGASIYSLHTAQVTVNYVPDVFGGTRRQIETADALVEVQAFQREGVYLTLTANIALAAIQEASLRGQIAATRRLIALQTELLGILRRRYNNGEIALPDVVAQETAVAQAKLLLPPLEKQLAQQRDLIAFLTGHFPSEEVAATFQLQSFRLPQRLPLSVPADLVRQRPDVRVAEANLHAVNAQIGVAIANRLPQITLTAVGGYQSSALTDLFSGPAGLWSFGGQLAQPIFTGGKIRSNVRLTEAQQQEAVLLYQQSIQQAFREVSDSLVAYRKNQEFRSQQQLLTNSAQDTTRLANMRYQGGVTSYLEVLDSDTRYFDAQIGLAQAQLNERLAMVQLYNALGGGWQQP